MRFTLTDEIDFPLELVFATLRDRTAELLAYMPNVDSIEVLEERMEDGVKHSVKRWLGSSDEIPAVARSIIKPDMLGWIDHARWDQNTWTCHWRHEYPALPGGVSGQGTNRFEDAGDCTIVHMEGHFDIRPDAISFVPAAIAKRAAPALERYIVGQLKPNMRAANAAVEEFLEDEEG